MHFGEKTVSLECMCPINTGLDTARGKEMKEKMNKRKEVRK
jgi:hypothetical protein